METAFISLIGSVTVAAITGIVTLIGIKSENSKRDAVRETKEAAKWDALEDRLERVDSRLEEHNNYAKLFSETSVTLGRIDERIKNLERK